MRPVGHRPGESGITSWPSFPWAVARSAPGGPGKGGRAACEGTGDQLISVVGGRGLPIPASRLDQLVGWPGGKEWCRPFEVRPVGRSSQLPPGGAVRDETSPSIRRPIGRPLPPADRAGGRRRRGFTVPKDRRRRTDGDGSPYPSVGKKIGRPTQYLSFCPRSGRARKVAFYARPPYKKFPVGMTNLDLNIF